MACRHRLTSHLGYCFSRNEKLRKNCVKIPDGGDDYDDVGDERLWENCDKIPFKRLALQVFTKLFARFNISKVPNVFPNSVIVVLLVVVKPYLTTAIRFQTCCRVQTPLSSKCGGMWRTACCHLSKSDRVPLNNISLALPLVWRPLPEYREMKN